MVFLEYNESVCSSFICLQYMHFSFGFICITEKVLRFSIDLKFIFCGLGNPYFPDRKTHESHLFGFYILKISNIASSAEQICPQFFLFGQVFYSHILLIYLHIFVSNMVRSLSFILKTKQGTKIRFRCEIATWFDKNHSEHDDLRLSWQLSV